MARLSQGDVEWAQTASGFTRIEVDIRSLADFAQALRREVEENLRPGWQAIEPTLNEPAFGLSPQLELDDKRGLYHDYLREAKELFLNLVEGVEQMAAAADRIASGYQGADQLGGLTVEHVAAELPPIPTPVVRSDLPVAGTWRAE